VLDDDDGVFAGEREDSSSASLVRLGVGHAGGGFIDEEKFGVLREEHSDLQPLLLPVSERATLSNRAGRRG